MMQISAQNLTVMEIALIKKLTLSLEIICQKCALGVLTHVSKDFFLKI